MLQPYDFLMLGVLVAAVLWGAWKGLAWQVASLGSLALSYMVAVNFRAPLAGVIKATPPWNVFLAMLILFLGSSLVVWVGFNLVRDAIEKMKLKEFDRHVGALVGLAKGVLLCILITFFALTLLGPGQKQTIMGSRSVYYIARVLDQAQPILPREIQPVLAEYRSQLGAPQSPYGPSAYPQPGLGGAFPQFDPNYGQPQYGPPQYGQDQFGTGQAPFPNLPNLGGQNGGDSSYYNNSPPRQADRFRQPY